MTNIDNIKNFADLLSICGILIPAIQRDYVQGRIHSIDELGKKTDPNSRELLKKV